MQLPTAFQHQTSCWIKSRYHYLLTISSSIYHDSTTSMTHPPILFGNPLARIDRVYDTVRPAPSPDRLRELEDGFILDCIITDKLRYKWSADIIPKYDARFDPYAAHYFKSPAVNLLLRKTIINVSWYFPFDDTQKWRYFNEGNWRDGEEGAGEAVNRNPCGENALYIELNIFFCMRKVYTILQYNERSTTFKKFIHIIMVHWFTVADSGGAGGQGSLGSTGRVE